MPKLLFAVVVGLLALLSAAGGRSDHHRRTRQFTSTATPSAPFTASPAPTDAPAQFVASEPTVTLSPTPSPTWDMCQSCVNVNGTQMWPSPLPPQPPTATYWPTAYP
jgi:hypothetical protein